MSEEIKELKDNEADTNAATDGGAKEEPKKAKKKKRSWKLGCFLVYIILNIIALVAITYSIDAAIKKAVETFGPKYTKCKVTVGKVETKLFKGSFLMEDFVFGNPSGYKTPSAASVGSVYVKVDMKSLFSDKIIIEEVLIDRPQLTYELKGMTSNIDVIQKNIEAQIPKATPEQQEAARLRKEEAQRRKEEEIARKRAEAEARGEEYVEPKGKSVLISLVKVTNCKVGFSMGMLYGKQATMPVPDIEIRDIGKDEKMTFDVAAARVMDQTLGSILDVSKNSMGSAADVTSDALEGLGKKTSSGLKKVDGSMQNFLDKMKGKNK